MTYEERLQTFKPYIKAIASRTHDRLPFASYDEVEQEIMLALWRCHKKYEDYDFKRFKNTFSKAINFAVRDMLRRQKRQATFSLIDDIMESDVVSVDFFKSSINEICESVSPEAVVVLMEKIDPNASAPKKDWRTKSRMRKGKREIQDFVYGK